MTMRIVCVLIVTAGLFTSGHAFDLRPSVADQLKIGREASAQIKKEEKVLPDTDPRVIWMRKIGKEYVEKYIPAAEKKKRPFEYTFDIIDSKEINAFALPGGPIFFYTGIIDTFTTEDQFAGVLGHEITHIRNQHWASQYADNLKRRLGLAVILTAIGANDDLWTVADVVDSGLFLLPYSRKHETEADKFGYDMVKQDGRNPMGMANVFTMLSGGKGGGYSEILATHPDPAKRAKAIEDRVKKETVTFPAQRPLPFETLAMKNLKKAGTGKQPKLLSGTHVCWGCGHDDGHKASVFDAFVAQITEKKLGY